MIFVNQGHPPIMQDKAYIGTLLVRKTNDKDSLH